MDYIRPFLIFEYYNNVKNGFLGYSATRRIFGRIKLDGFNFLNKHPYGWSCDIYYHESLLMERPHVDISTIDHNKRWKIKFATYTICSRYIWFMEKKHRKIKTVNQLFFENNGNSDIEPIKRDIKKTIKNRV